MNSEAFWQVKKEFADKYGVNFVNMGGKAPADPASLKEEFRSNLKVVMDVLASDTALVDYLAERLVEIGDSVPEESKSFVLGKKGNPFKDKRLYDFKKYPEGHVGKTGDQELQPRSPRPVGRLGPMPSVKRSTTDPSLLSAPRIYRVPPISPALPRITATPKATAGTRGSARKTV